MKENQIKPFGMKDKLGYMFGNVANDLTFVMASMFLMVFYTDILKINAALVGTMFLVARVVDAFTDTIMGRIADKVKAGKGGKFKPWLIRMCGPVALASFLMYQTSMAEASMTVRIIYMFTTYLFWGSICYTAINIPYGSMASVMSAEADDRAALSTFRGVGSLFSGMLIGVVLPMFLYKTLEDGTQVANAELFPIVTLLCSAAAAVMYLVCYKMCTERITIDDSQRQNVNFGKTLKALLKNRALIGIIIVYISLLAGQMFLQTMQNYIFKDYFNNTLGISIMGAAGMVPMLLLAPLAVPLSRKMGKREMGIACAVLSAVAYLLLFILHTDNMWVFIIISIVSSLGFSLFNLIIWAFVTDIIDDHEIKTGMREDGTIYAVCSFSRKVGQAIASGLGGWMLALIGYVEGAPTQTTAVINNMYNISTLLPVCLYVVVILALTFIYTLNKKKVEENIAILKARREAAN